MCQRKPHTGVLLQPPTESQLCFLLRGIGLTYAPFYTKLRKAGAQSVRGCLEKATRLSLCCTELPQSATALASAPSPVQRPQGFRWQIDGMFQKPIEVFNNLFLEILHKQFSQELS